MANRVAAGLLKTVLVLSVLFIQSKGQVMIGLSELDYTRPESEGGTGILVIKRNTNVADLFLNIQVLTVDDYDRMFNCSTLPDGLDCTTGDPAEFVDTGKQDFINDEIQVMFPPTSSPEEAIEILIPFINDDINEARENFLIVVRVDELLSSPTDVANVQLIRNGVAQVNIENDDVLELSFEMRDYEIPEDAGVQDNLIFIIKENGMESEQVLPLIVELVDAVNEPAIRDEDFEINRTFPYIIEFEPLESRINVPLTVFEDDILEVGERFLLFLSIPVNSPLGYGLGTNPSATVTIVDNEEGRVGIEQETYVVNEGDGFVEVCFVLFEPSDANLLDINAFAEFGWQTNNGTALGEGEDYETFIAAFLNRPFIFRDTPRVCFNITIIDDALDEGTEEFTVAISLDVNDPVIFPPTFAGNFIVDPVNATIVIMDDDDSPTVFTVTPGTEETTTDDSDTGNRTTGTTDDATTTEELTTTEEPPTTTEEPPTTTEEPPITMGGDPHYSILLPTGQNLCYSVQGEHGFTFNLISNNKMQMNAMFVPDARREEVTWIGALGIVLKNVRYKNSNKTKIRFVASENKLYVGEEMSLNAEMVDKLEFSNGKLRISEAERKKGSKRLDVEVDLRDIGLKFTVRFVKKCHLDMFWNEVVEQPRNSHGMIGQFFRSGVEIDETRRLLLLPTMEPVPVMRKLVWHFMEREEAEDKMCWVAMNPGYQGKKLLEGHYLDYLVNDVLSSDFKFTA